MPKKTKREKILAEYRKKLKQLQLNQNIIVTTNNKMETASVTLLPKKTVVYQESEYDKLLAKFTIQDLKKTSLVTLFILALEFFIFYVNLKGIMK
jgi:hypothetical protein